MKRIKYIDILRGWAVLLMVFWHMTEALISDSIRLTSFFDISQFIGGLVAPMFLFSSGASHSIIILKKRESFIKFTPNFRKRIIRIFQILIIAYLLHLPENNLLEVIITRQGSSYINFINMDVLQLIAVSLLLLQILFLIIKNNKIYFYIVGIIGVITILLTPYIWQINFSDFLPVELASCLNNKTGSLFPIFPWLSYVFFGAMVMQFVMEKGEENTIKKMLILGFIIILLGLVPQLLNLKSTPNYDFWQTSPNIFLIKFGIVLVFLSIFYFMDKFKNYEMKYFGVFGKESLFIYVVHLLMIYGHNFYTLQTNFGRKLNWFELFIAYFIMIIFLRYLGIYWGVIKDKFKRIRVSKV